MFLVDDKELFESSYIPVKYPLPEKAGFDEVIRNTFDCSVPLTGYLDFVFSIGSAINARCCSCGLLKSI